MAILPRQNYYYYYGYNSPWSNYGRWIVLAVIIVVAFLVFLLISCLNARRRRRAGLNPYRGTGWLAGSTPPGHAPAQYTGGPPQPYYNNAPQPAFNPNPPIYSPPQTQPYGTEHQGYFGGQQTGIELQQPNNSYQPQRGGEPVYGAPAGPPPAKRSGDGIIR